MMIDLLSSGGVKEYIPTPSNNTSSSIADSDVNSGAISIRETTSKKRKHVDISLADSDDDDNSSKKLKPSSSSYDDDDDDDVISSDARKQTPGSQSSGATG
jgi:hypothetical protein